MVKDECWEGKRGGGAMGWVLKNRRAHTASVRKREKLTTPESGQEKKGEVIKKRMAKKDDGG